MIVCRRPGCQRKFCEKDVVPALYRSAGADFVWSLRPQAAEKDEALETRPPLPDVSRTRERSYFFKVEKNVNSNLNIFFLSSASDAHLSCAQSDNGRVHWSRKRRTLNFVALHQGSLTNVHILHQSSAEDLMSPTSSNRSDEESARKLA